MDYVFVLNNDGKPLIPTKRYRHVRKLLESGKAISVNNVPFTIKLTYRVDNISSVTLAIDPGRTNIGMAVIKDNGECVFNAIADTNNLDVTKRMESRAAYRRMRRQHAREKRRRRAVKAKTRKAERFKRILPGCEKPIECHDIKNSPSKFNNRKRNSDWLTPTARQALDVHMSLINNIRKVVNIKSVAVEVNRFAFMQMEDPSVTGIDFQNGPLKGYDSVEDAVYEIQHGNCLLCGKHDIKHCHHIKPKHLGGSDNINNRAGLCEECHDLVHKDKDIAAKLKKEKAGFIKKHAGASVLNQIIPFLCKAIMNTGVELHVTNGYETKVAREANSLPKDHNVDAYVIGCNCMGINPEYSLPGTYKLIHYRRHSRNAVHANNYNRGYYNENNEKLCVNRNKATEQKSNSLAEYRSTHTEQEVSKLKVKDHKPDYVLRKEYTQGSRFLYNGKEYTLNSYDGTHTRKNKTTGEKERVPKYCISTSGEKLSYSKCCFVKHNGGWNYA